MNAERRKRLGDLAALVTGARNVAEELLTEEQEALEGVPENLQDTERVSLMQQAVEGFEAARDALEEVEGNLDELCDLLEVGSGATQASLGLVSAQYCPTCGDTLDGNG